jgi:DNA-3-methyladenine glycosylase I
MKMPNKKRCDWVGSDPLMVEYHDREWGKPIRQDRLLFEFLILEGAQAGLAWKTVLKKRGGYLRAFDNLEPKKVSKYTDKDIERLMNDRGIIRNRLKIAAAIQNAKRFLEVQREFGSFDKYIWGFVGGKPVKKRIVSIKDIPATTRESDMMSKDLAKRGFKFVGSTICYAFMQAVGMANDHQIKCFRRGEIK